jgi:hypothetical protein
MNKVVPMLPSLAISQETADQAMREIGSRRKRNRKMTPRADKHVGCPWGFLQAAARAVEGKAALLLALIIYRRCKICKSKTVTLPTDELVGLNISRSTCRWALRQLQAAKLIQLHPIAPGHKATITLLWPPRAVYDEGASEV